MWNDEATASTSILRGRVGIPAQYQGCTQTSRKIAAKWRYRRRRRELPQGCHLFLSWVLKLFQIGAVESHVKPGRPFVVSLYHLLIYLLAYLLGPLFPTFLVPRVPECGKISGTRIGLQELRKLRLERVHPNLDPVQYRILPQRHLLQPQGATLPNFLLLLGSHLRRGRRRDRQEVS